MVKNFNKKAKNYEKTICAAISILAFLVIGSLLSALLRLEWFWQDRSKH